MNYIRHLGVLLLALSTSMLWGQQTISGTVTDENNQPLPGATVIVQGTNRGTTTDFDGNYQISAAQGEMLIFSYVGYTTQRISIESSDSNLVINTYMQPDNELEEVIVLGYSTQNRNETTGSASGGSRSDQQLSCHLCRPSTARKGSRTFFIGYIWNSWFVTKHSYSREKLHHRRKRPTVCD